MKHTHIPNLDGLRGLAALSVVISHAAKGGLLPEVIFGHALGEYGVMVFFALSGFLMQLLYAEQNFNKREIFNFAVSRFARVYPLFALAIIFHWALFSAGFTGADVPEPYITIDTQDLWLHLLLLKGENVFWTISPEFQFYGFFILIWFLTFKTRGQTYPFITVLLLLIITNMVMIHGANKTLLLYSFNFFLTGALAGHIYAKYGEVIKARTRGAEFLFLGLLFILSLPPLYRVVFQTEQLKFLSPVNSLIAGGLVFFAAVGGKYIDWFLGHKWTRFLGLISFSLYLLHMPLLTFYTGLALDWPVHPWLLFFPFCALIIAASTASYTLIENPARRGIKKALIR